MFKLLFFMILLCFLRFAFMNEKNVFSFMIGYIVFINYIYIYILFFLRFSYDFLMCFFNVFFMFFFCLFCILLGF